MRKIIITILLVLLSINVMYVFCGVLFHPLQSMDSMGIWLLKAKAFYLEQGFPNQFLHNPAFWYSHQQYSIGLPFFFSLMYKALGGVNEQFILLLYPIIYVTILVIAYKIFRKKTDTCTALLFTYVYSMIAPLIAGGGRILAGNADIFLVLIEWILIFLLYKNKYTVKIYVAIVMLIMIASQIKLEGAFLSLIVLFLPITILHRFLLFIIAVIPFVVWQVTIYILQIPSDTHIVIPSIAQFFDRIIIIMWGIGRELLNINNWYFLWPLIFITIFIHEKISVVTKNILLPSYFLMLGCYILVYMTSSNETYPYVSSSFDRVLLQHSAIIYLYFFEKIHPSLVTFVQSFQKRLWFR